MSTEQSFYEVAMAEAVSFVAAGCFVPARPAITEADAKQLAEAWSAPEFYHAAVAETESVVTERAVVSGDRAQVEAAREHVANGKPKEQDRLEPGVRPETH